jgi:hypothetical protein
MAILTAKKGRIIFSAATPLRRADHLNGYWLASRHGRGKQAEARVVFEERLHA